MLANLHRNCMGTTSFDGRFPGMRKSQDFIVYPMREHAEYAQIQSDTRIGRIDIATGAVLLSPPRAGGSYGVHLALATVVCTLPAEDLLLLKAHIFGSAGAHVGTNGVMYTDNSAAANVFGAKP